ncbi:MAG: TerB family tellurite resistance protein, partial [Myxococcota bacterium]
MSGRVAQWIDALQNPSSQLKSTHPADDALFAMLVHVAYADGTVDEEEFDRLMRVSPGLELGAVLSRVVDEANEPMNFEGLFIALPDREDRDLLMKLATTMALSDDHIAVDESEFLQRLAT